MAWVALGGAILREGSIPQGDSIPRAHSILARIISRFTAAAIIFIMMATAFTTTETIFSIIFTSLTMTSYSDSVTRFMATLITIIPMIMGITIIRENYPIATIRAI